MFAGGGERGGPRIREAGEVVVGGSAWTGRLGEAQSPTQETEEPAAKRSTSPPVPSSWPQQPSARPLAALQRLQLRGPRGLPDASTAAATGAGSGLGRRTRGEGEAGARPARVQPSILPKRGRSRHPPPNVAVTCTPHPNWSEVIANVAVSIARK